MFQIKFTVYSRWRRDYSHAVSTSSLQMRNLRCPDFFFPLVASLHAVLIVAIGTFALIILCSRVATIFLSIMLLL